MSPTDIPVSVPPLIVPVLLTLVTVPPEIVPEPAVLSSTAVIVPLSVPTFMFVIVPAPWALTVPAMSPTEIPVSVPPLIVPVLLTLVTVPPEIVPEPAVLSSTAVIVPLSVPTFMFVIVPAPWALTVPAMSPTEIPVSVPPLIVPVLLTLVTVPPEIVPEPAVLSSTAVIVPLSVPTFMFVIVPAPWALTVPAMSPTEIPVSVPPLIVPVLLTLVTVPPEIVPEPAVLSSTAVIVPLSVPTFMFVIVPAPWALTVPAMSPTEIPVSVPPLIVPVLLTLVTVPPEIVPEPAVRSTTPVISPLSVPTFMF